MSDRRSLRGSFYGDKPSKSYEQRRRTREGESADRSGKPVELGKEYRVRITDLSGRREGVAKIEGFIVFVPGAKPGEEVTIRITRVSSRVATGEIVPEKPATPPPSPETTPASAPATSQPP